MPVMNALFTEEQDSRSAISDADFRRLSEFVSAQYGIMMPLTKKNLFIDRMQKRLPLVGMRSFKDYIDWVLDNKQSGEELIQFIDVVTTKETDFFHEASHFEFLVQTALPELIKSSGAGIRRDLMIWSAGCSSGEEPYTLAMVIKEFAHHYPGIDFRARVLATDISSQALATATDAVYDREKAAPIPLGLKQKYLLKSRDPAQNLIRIVPELRDMVKFRSLNVMDADFGLRELMDIIFCRNLIIHFNRPAQEDLVNKICRYLSPGGYLFLGHAENLNNLRVPVVPASATVYRMPP